MSSDRRQTLTRLYLHPKLFATASKALWMRPPKPLPNSPDSNDSTLEKHLAVMRALPADQAESVMACARRLLTSSAKYIAMLALACAGW